MHKRRITDDQDKEQMEKEEKAHTQHEQYECGEEIEPQMAGKKGERERTSKNVSSGVSPL